MMIISKGKEETPHHCVASSKFFMKTHKDTMKILTFNILTAGKDLFPSRKGWWITRMLGTMRMLKAENPDIFVLNEVTPLQMFVLLFLKGYKHRGGLTQNPVFFKKRFKVIESKWKVYDTLSDYLRSYTYVWLKDTELKHHWEVIGTHIDWDESTREKQKEEMFKNLCHGTAHKLVCGDFNKEDDTLDYLTPTKPTTGTYHDINGEGISKIDYIFNNLDIEDCKVLTQYKDISDHYPVVVEF